jgi:hypothetical protein
MWEIYSIGDSAFLEQVLNAVAMITGTGDFTSMVHILSSFDHPIALTLIAYSH